MSEFRSADDALAALGRGDASLADVAAYLAALPVTRQHPWPTEPWADSYAPNDGPVNRVNRAFFAHRITGVQRVILLEQLRENGHEA